MKKKRMYIVKIEVLVTDIRSAYLGKGKIYSIEEADEKYQPEDKKPLEGFNIKI